MDVEKIPEVSLNPDDLVRDTPAPTDNPISSDIVLALEDLKSVVGDVSTTIINRFVAYYNTHYSGGLSNPDYVIWRSSQYDYHMVVITDGTYSNGSVSGTFDMISYNSTSYYDSMPLVSVQTLSNRNLAIPAPAASGSGYVYSSIDGYLPAPNIDTSTHLSLILSFSMFCVLLIALIYLWIRGIFKRA